ncbi:hypothetical protein DSLASN_34480 [Desulfoluna limicola]|uniref:Methyltransferase domain-containing protein n=1 Tax=Desulfoluna limicola TaxID=2810562 RepID=A0ABM7PKK8_9BACT|nr:class I SAM-dependent methyltransferase [Desulfoluna limicola]BCS97816.1 hypothetical protein DSLASN_34480 [Desulfoluna limicola]
MNIQKLIEAARKPEIYAKGTANMWVDAHIAQQLLETHLSQDTDLASRKESTISSTVQWILNQVHGDSLTILDLGCGPGLYTERLAEKGHDVTGMDFSSNSIRYARESAQQKQLNIAYIQQDYLELDEENRYDLILMIFLDVCVLSPNDRAKLLKRIYRALKPGGTVLFDVLNVHHTLGGSESKDWQIAEQGFWRNRPYLALSETFYYEEQNVLLNQHVVMDEDESIDVYRFWRHTFSPAGIKQVLAEQGFRFVSCHEGILPDCDLYRSEDVTFCMALK